MNKQVYQQWCINEMAEGVAAYSQLKNRNRSLANQWRVYAARMRAHWESVKVMSIVNFKLWYAGQRELEAKQAWRETEQQYFL